MVLFIVPVKIALHFPLLWFKEFESAAEWVVDICNFRAGIGKNKSKEPVVALFELEAGLYATCALLLYAIILHQVLRAMLTLSEPPGLVFPVQAVVKVKYP